MEFEAAFTLTDDAFKRGLREYKRFFPECLAWKTVATRMYFDTPSFDLYRAGMSTCVAVNPKIGLCILTKSTVLENTDYVAREEVKSAVEPANLLERLQVRFSLLGMTEAPRAVFSITSRRRHIALQTGDDAIIASFDRMTVKNTQGQTFLHFNSMEIEFNGDSPTSQYLAELRRVNQFAPGGDSIRGKYSQ
jgi:hypothetical protein